MLQVGVVASKYIVLNKHWNEAKYLNLMNNLICGVPLLFMRRLSEDTYLKLSQQVWCSFIVCIFYPTTAKQKGGL